MINKIRARYLLRKHGAVRVDVADPSSRRIGYDILHESRGHGRKYILTQVAGDQVLLTLIFDSYAHTHTVIRKRDPDLGTFNELWEFLKEAARPGEGWGRVRCDARPAAADDIRTEQQYIFETYQELLEGPARLT